jgi:hypothetical protein
LDKAGNIAIQEQFDDAKDFQENWDMAVACIGRGDERRCGYINHLGRFVINPQFFHAFAFDKRGIAAVNETSDSWPSYIDLTGKIIWKGELDVRNK